MNGGVFLPGSTIGVIGGGQLGRMLVLEARRMGYRTIVLDPDEGAPAGQISDEHIVAPLTDVSAARELAMRADVVTLEWENADLAAVAALEELVAVRPGAKVLEVAQNRLLEKQAALRLGAETAPFRGVSSLDELLEGLSRFGTPSVLKTASGGYDGKGQRIIRGEDEVVEAFQELGSGSVPLILEGWVSFALEASVICARSLDGTIECFPVVENIHRNGILDFTVAPARISADVQRKAEEIGRKLIEGLEVVGLLAVELFIDTAGHVLVNEIAPRPHNSGHYTWEACSVSQFEQQLRAACGLPLEKPQLLSAAAMANLLGEDIGDGSEITTLPEVLSTPSLALHLYGKASARPGRKMGHLTILSADPSKALESVAAARARMVEGYKVVEPLAEPADTL